MEWGRCHGRGRGCYDPSAVSVHPDVIYVVTCNVEIGCSTLSHHPRQPPPRRPPTSTTATSTTTTSTTTPSTTHSDHRHVNHPCQRPPGAQHLPQLPTWCR